MYTIPPELELHIRESLDKWREDSHAKFSLKWVEKAFTWTLYAAGAVVIAATIKSIAPFL